MKKSVFVLVMAIVMAGAAGVAMASDSPASTQTTTIRVAGSTIAGGAGGLGGVAGGLAGGATGGGGAELKVAQY